MHPLSWLDGLGRLQVTQDLSEKVHSNDEDYAARTGLRKLGLRQLRRSIYLSASGQKRFLHERIGSAWRRGLWLYRGVPQIGDALMDLAPRSLLRARGIGTDLCTDPHIAAMFEGDPWFGKVFDAVAAPDPAAYDFVIVQSYKSRSLKEKTAFFRTMPWMSIHGFYTGPEFHRAEFATRRLYDALGLRPVPGEFAAHARQKLLTLPPPALSGAAPANCVRVALALGGVDPLRTYTRWAELKALLEKHLCVEWTLLGSSNGAEAARRFAASPGPNAGIRNLAGQTSLAQCRLAIQAQDVLVACDGGLMHLGVTTGSRLVALFTGTVSPQWRLPEDLRAAALVSATNAVDDIDPAGIANAILMALNKVPAKETAGMHQRSRNTGQHAIPGAISEIILQ